MKQYQTTILQGLHLSVSSALVYFVFPIKTGRSSESWKKEKKKNIIWNNFQYCFLNHEGKLNHLLCFLTKSRFDPWIPLPPPVWPQFLPLFLVNNGLTHLAPTDRIIRCTLWALDAFGVTLQWTNRVVRTVLWASK